ncbi:hypothetical protein [Streptosporangium roseum]|uniref:hypothetical protein n=1 Tax=Streptosporangium roseum TaxID=2001 RepID=UPI003332CA33
MLKKFGITGDKLDKDAKPLVRLRMCQVLLGVDDADLPEYERWGCQARRTTTL